MSTKVKLFVTELDADSNNSNRLQQMIEQFPEFEIYTIKEEPQTQAARIMSEFVTSNKSNTLTKRISEIFITVGIPAHIKGYQFLREAIMITISQPDIINSITKQLYPQVATKFATSPSKVERAIRHAIEVGWARGKIENINNIFGVKVYGHNDRPTNGEFIALVADKMLVDGVGS